ncbi:hypothetical protein E3N88_46161 [Mikania micrantha]|uniref:Uncharacterized protein n=1 Tax=Mikania micrantha TaxID=192012 RepID=A0A5N6L719_9ASTR|nr:hypothetical protein E3N88_46161 [Mikania micrantha]
MKVNQWEALRDRRSVPSSPNYEEHPMASTERPICGPNSSRSNGLVYWSGYVGRMRWPPIEDVSNEAAGSNEMAAE